MSIDAFYLTAQVLPSTSQLRFSFFSKKIFPISKLFNYLEIGNIFWEKNEHLSWLLNGEKNVLLGKQKGIVILSILS